jgi:hypothetical protein
LKLIRIISGGGAVARGFFAKVLAVRLQHNAVRLEVIHEHVQRVPAVTTTAISIAVDNVLLREDLVCFPGKHNRSFRDRRRRKRVAGAAELLIFDRVHFTPVVDRCIGCRGVVGADGADVDVTARGRPPLLFSHHKHREELQFLFIGSVHPRVNAVHRGDGWILVKRVHFIESLFKDHKTLFFFGGSCIRLVEFCFKLFLVGRMAKLIKASQKKIARKKKDEIKEIIQKCENEIKGTEGIQEKEKEKERAQ